jgi:hypothetical protein
MKAAAKGGEEKQGPVSACKDKGKADGKAAGKKAAALPKGGVDASDDTKQKTHKGGPVEAANDTDDDAEGSDGDDGGDGEEAANVAAARFEVDSDAGDGDGDDNSDGDVAEERLPVPVSATGGDTGRGRAEEKAQKARVRSIQSNAQKQATGGGGGGFFGFGLGSGTKDVDGLLMHDDELLSLGRQMRAVEGEVRRDADDRTKAWTATAKPRLEREIAEWDKKCAALRSRIEGEARKGLAHIGALEDELRPAVDALETAKKALYLPTSAIVLGQGGVSGEPGCVCACVHVFGCDYGVFIFPLL